METIRNDEGHGLYLTGDGTRNFKVYTPPKAASLSPGDMKDITAINFNGKEIIIAAKNDDFLQFVEIEKSNNSRKNFLS